MKLTSLSILVQDQAKALAFYRDVLGFVTIDDVDMGGPRWITMESPEQAGGARISLEPLGYDWIAEYQAKLKANGVPLTCFAVPDIAAEYARLTAAGVAFASEPKSPAPGLPPMARFDDQCGNWILLSEEPKG